MKSPAIPKWQQPAFEIARLIYFNFPGRFKRLPSKFEVNEWEIMRDFADEIENHRIRQDLERAIHGSGAFRYFKDTIHRHKIEKDWYAFRYEALREIARECCEGHKIPWK